MADILDFLSVEAPEVYARTKYRIIEISDRLVGKQKGSISGSGRRERGGMSEGEMGKEKAKRRGHEDKVEVIGKSIFEWDKTVHEPCFFLAMEVLVSYSLFLSFSLLWVFFFKEETDLVRSEVDRIISHMMLFDTLPTLTNPSNVQSRSIHLATTTSSIPPSPTL